MIHQKTRHIGLAALAAVLATGVCLWPAAEAAEIGQAERPVRIGMVDTLFKNVPDTLVRLMAKPFNTLMATQTGMKGDMLKGGDCLQLGRKLMDKDVHLGIFLGYEFAWTRQHYPELKPLMIVINRHPKLHAYLVCPAKDGPAGWADLKNQKLTIGKGTRPHCQLYLEKRCQDHCQCDPNGLSGICKSSSLEDAMDDVVDGIAQATIIDSVSLENYKRRKPGRFTRLKIAEESESFPAAVVAYRPGVMDADKLSRFRKGMRTANQSTLGRQLLTLWKITSFEEVPEDYEATLKTFIESYPPPAGMEPQQ